MKVDSAWVKLKLLERLNGRNQRIFLGYYACGRTGYSYGHLRACIFSYRELSELGLKPAYCALFTRICSINAFFTAKNELKRTGKTVFYFEPGTLGVLLIMSGIIYSPLEVKLISKFMSFSRFALTIYKAVCLKKRQFSDLEVFISLFEANFLELEAKTLKISGKKIEKIFTITLIIVIFISLAGLMYLIMTPKEEEGFTEFYILGPQGIADNYPAQFMAGENETVIIGIVNHEYKKVNYSMEVRLENISMELPETQKHISLSHNETWEEPVTIAPPFEGTNMKLEFLLFNETEKTIPYRSLRLWIDVTKKAGEK